MFHKQYLLLLVLILLLLFSFQIEPEKEEKISIPEPIKEVVEEIKEEVVEYFTPEKEIGYLIIPKLHLKEPLFEKNSKENTIEKHVTILKESTDPQEEESLMILAAHSGTAGVAYFEHLDQLEFQDEVEVLYEGKSYHYFVSSIYEEEKNGFIHINQNKNRQLILTTCSPKKENTQLIVICKEKES